MPLTQYPSAAELEANWKSMTEGGAAGGFTVGGQDISQPLTMDLFRYKTYPNQQVMKGRTTLADMLKKAGAEVYTDSSGRLQFKEGGKGVTLQDLAKTGFDPAYFTPDFQQSLEAQGIKYGGRLSEANVNRLMAGSLPAVKDLRNQLADRAFNLLGLAEPGVIGGPTDLVGRAGLENLTQDIRGAYTARGLGGSGQAAFFEGTQGIQFLEGLRQSRQAEGLGLLNTAFPEFGAQFGLGLQQQAFAQHQFGQIFDIIQQMNERGIHTAGLEANRNREMQQIGLIGGAVFGGAQVGLGAYDQYRQSQPGAGFINPYAQPTYTA